MKKLLLFAVAVIGIAQVARVDRDNSFTGYNDLSTGSLKPPLKTVAGLPSAASSTNKTFVVTDGTSASDCAVGGGSTRSLCVSNGSAWVALGGSGSASGNGYTTVSFSATPTFTAASTTGTAFLITLTGNVTSSTLAGATTGQIISFKICQDGTGSRTFVWPTTVLNAGTIEPTASTCTIQVFVYDGTNAQAMAGAYVTGATTDGFIRFPGSTSGSATVGVAAAAGTPARINLPTATGSANYFLKTDGSTPQQLSWAAGTSTSGFAFANYGGWTSAASTTYRWAQGGTSNSNCAANINYYSIVVPVSGTISEFYVSTYISGTLASAGTVTFTLEEECVATALTVGQSWTSINPAVASDTAHTETITAGQRVQLKIATPAWSTAATNIFVAWGFKVTGAN